MLTCLPARLTQPCALTSRSTSTAGGSSGCTPGSGEGRPGRPPSARSRARSRWDSRDAVDLIRPPSTPSTCRRSVSTHTITGRPARAGPSQICCWPTIRLPEGGTARSTSTGSASGGDDHRVRVDRSSRSRHRGWGEQTGRDPDGGQDTVHSGRGRPEPVGRVGVVDALMRTAEVVLGHERVHRRLGLLDRGEHPPVQALTLQGLVKPLHLPGRGRRPRLRQTAR